MKLLSLKKHIEDHEDFFTLDHPNVDLSFLLNPGYYQYVDYGDQELTVYTPNMLYVDINWPERMESIEGLDDDHPLMQLVDEYRQAIWMQFPMNTLAYFDQRPVSFLQNMEIACNIVPIRRVRKTDLANKEFLQQINGLIFWNMGYLCSLIPEGIDHLFDHRLVFSFMNLREGFQDFYLDEIELDLAKEQ